MDNGPEFTAKAFLAWAEKHHIRITHINPGKPMENAFVESFQGSFRDECLNVNWFMSIEDAKEKIESWRRDYNGFRPHSSLNDMTPEEFAEMCRQRVA